MQPLPELPTNVRFMLEGLDLVMRTSADARAAELVAERAYGFVFGIETIGVLPQSITDQLHRWVDATYTEVKADLATGPSKQASR